MSIWKIDYEARKIVGTDINVAKLKRTVLCMVMDRNDEVLYCGTSTGDILKIRLNYHHDRDILDTVQRPIMVGCYGRLDEKKLVPHEKVKLYGMGKLLILLYYLLHLVRILSNLNIGSYLRMEKI